MANNFRPRVYLPTVIFLPEKSKLAPAHDKINKCITCLCILLYYVVNEIVIIVMFYKFSMDNSTTCGASTCFMDFLLLSNLYISICTE